MVVERNLNLLKLPAHSRVWVYQSNRVLTDQEANEISTLGHEFVQNWASHGKDLQASCDVIYNRFVVLAVDEQVAMASGCSIDSSVGWIKAIQQKYGVDLLDKMLISFRSEKGIEVIKMNDFRDLLDNRTLDKDTIVFNNLVTNVGEFSNGWETSILNSWHKQLLP